VQKSRNGIFCDAFEVIAGMHRVKAFRWLQKTHIPAVIVEVDDLRAELMLIDENLRRNDLTPAERASALARRKRIWQELHPETKRGATGVSRPKEKVGKVCQPISEDAEQAIEEPAKRYDEAAAAATGESARKVRLDVHRGEVLGEAALAKVMRTSLDKGEELDALAKLKKEAPEKCEDLIERAAYGEKVSAKVEAKKIARQQREKELGDKQKALPQLSVAWQRFDACDALKVGKAAEHLVCADLLMRGYNVSLASQGSPYDAIVEVDGELLRVQIKSSQWTRNINASGRNERQAYSWRIRDAQYNGDNILKTTADIIACVAMDIMMVAYFAAYDCPATVQLDASDRESKNNYARTFDRPIYQWPFDEALKKARGVGAYIELKRVFPPFPRRRFGVILADPPWEFEVYSERGMGRAAANHYPTLTTDIIKGVGPFIPCADDCALFLWATAPMLPDAMAVMRAWGFSYKTHLVWVKDRIGTGYWVRSQHELLLIGTRGNIPAPSPGTQCPSVIEAPVGEHSTKPECFAELIERMFPSLPKIELNRRGPARPGWAAWGNEAETQTAQEPSSQAVHSEDRSAEAPPSIEEYASPHVFDGVRPLSSERAEKLRQGYDDSELDIPDRLKRDANNRAPFHQQHEKSA
jgi:N6-adenosine-specific RNA methylase IME4/ParB-like chromosome segregation protein Spo0J